MCFENNGRFLEVMTMTLPDVETREPMLATGIMREGMELSYQQLDQLSLSRPRQASRM